MRFFPVGLGVVALLGSCTWAAAAPATLDEARIIRSALERYLGRGTEAAPTVVVTPAGENYTIAVDLKAVLHPLVGFGLDLDAATYAMTVTPQDGGLWRVTSAGLPRLHFGEGERSYSVVVNGMQSDGIFDPKIPGFTSSAASYDSLSVATLGDPGGTQTRDETGGKQSVIAKPAAREGSIDGVYTGSLTHFLQDVTLDQPIKGIGGKSSKFTVRSGLASQTVRLDALQIRSLLDIWAFFVAHPARDQIKTAQEELRGLLRAALPLFGHVAEDGIVASVAADTPFGAFAAQSLSGGITTTGLTQDGHLETHLKVDGISVPGDLVPAWAAGLVPTGLDIGESVSGFRLDAAADAAVAGFDLSKVDPFTPDQMETIRAALGPLDQMRVSIAPSRLTSALLDLSFSGDIRFSRPVPEVRMVVKAKGLDAAVKSVQSSARGNVAADQVVAAMMLAKGFGNAEPDGTLSWTIANSAAGEITVNGIALPFGKQ